MNDDSLIKDYEDILRKYRLNPEDFDISLNAETVSPVPPLKGKQMHLSNALSLITVHCKLKGINKTYEESLRSIGWREFENDVKNGFYK
jgi:hypothetical protein